MLHLPARAASPISSSTRCRIARARAERHHRRRRHRQLQPVGPAGRSACARPAAGSSRTSGCAGTRWRASTTARTASCSSSTAGSRSPGGAGIADWWALPEGQAAALARHDGEVRRPIVAALQGVAAENWLECCGEILTGPEYFPNLDPAGDTTAFVIRSSPSDRATASRVAFQLLMEGADQDVRISTPYFLPDRALRRALKDIAQRGVTRLGDRARAAGPISAGSGSPAGGCGASCCEAGVRHLRVPRDDDAREGAGHRRAVGRARHDQHRQSVVRAQRRDQRRPARRRGRGTAARGLRARPARQRGDHAGRLAAAAALGERSPARSSGSWSGSSDRGEIASPRRAQNRHLQHPSLPRHGSAHGAAAHRRSAARHRCRRRRAAGSDRRRPGRRRPGRRNRRRARHGLGHDLGAAPAPPSVRQRHPQPLSDRAPQPVRPVVAHVRAARLPARRSRSRARTACCTSTTSISARRCSSAATRRRGSPPTSTTTASGARRSSSATSTSGCAASPPGRSARCSRASTSIPT